MSSWAALAALGASKDVFGCFLPLRTSCKTVAAIGGSLGFIRPGRESALMRSTKRSGPKARLTAGPGRTADGRMALTGCMLQLNASLEVCLQSHLLRSGGSC